MKIVVRGDIVDGGGRDSGFIERSGFLVFCRYLTPRDIVGARAVETTGQPVAMGDDSMRSGDDVVADRHGVVIVGADPKEAYLRYGKF